MPERGLAVRVYFLTRRACDRVWWLAHACLSGVWLGVLDVETLHAIDREYYDGKKAMYAGETWNTRGLLDWERAALDAHFSGCDRLLVASVGGGREVIGLAAAGYAADGFECHPDLRERARELTAQAGLDSEIFDAPPDRCPDVDRVYDGLIVGWGGYMHIKGRERRVAFLRECRARVRDGAPILVSFFTRTADERRYRLVTGIGNVLRRLLGRERIELGDTMDTNYVHCFTREEIAGELRDAGFELASFASQGYGRAVAIAGGAPVARPSAISAAASVRRTA